MVFWAFFFILLVCFFIVFVFYRNLVEAVKTLNGYSRARYALSYRQYDAVVKKCVIRCIYNRGKLGPDR